MLHIFCLNDPFPSLIAYIFISDLFNYDVQKKNFIKFASMNIILSVVQLKLVKH